MKRLLAIILLVLAVAVGCADNKKGNDEIQFNSETVADKQNSLTTQKEVTEETNQNTPKDTEGKYIVETKDILDVTASVLFRISETKDEKGYQPPFTEASVIFSLDKKPKTGDFVTIVPVIAGLPTINVPINKIEELSEDIDENSKITWYNTYIDHVKESKYLSYKPEAGTREETPFSLLCIYPAIKYASAVDIKEVNINDLSKTISGVSLKTNDLRYAIDTNADNKPDLAMAQVRDGDYTISYYFIKIKDKWNLFKQNNPM